MPPMHPLRPYASNYDLHALAGGLPLCPFTAPNIHLKSKQQAGGLQTGKETNIPIQKCGSKRTHYAPSRKLIIPRLLPLRKEHP